MRVLAREYPGPRGLADGLRRVRAVAAYAAACEAVQVGRLKAGVAVAAQHVPALRVGHYQNNFSVPQTYHSDKKFPLRQIIYHAPGSVSTRAKEAARVLGFFKMVICVIKLYNF